MATQNRSRRVSLDAHVDSLETGTNEIQFDIPEPTFCEAWCNIGNYANITSFVILILGVILTYATDKNNEGVQTLARYILSLGLFAFAGGITNWLAVKMLFDQIWCLYGSGVIPRQFIGIRRALKEIIMKNFFDEEYMKSYLESHVKEKTGDIETQLAGVIDSPQTDQLIDSKINQQLQNPMILMMLAAAGISNPTSLVVLLKPLIKNFAKGLIPQIKEKLDTGDALGGLSDNIHADIDKMLEDRLQYLTADAVKKLIEDVIRRHLHWLVIWGNVFGGFIGLLSAVANWPSPNTCGA